MLHEVVAATNAEGFRIGLVVTTFGFGFRHGIDWDHIAAITDITGSQATRRTSMVFATLYALGHGLVVFGLGFAAIVLSEQLPAGVDGVMERFVGVTTRSCCRVGRSHRTARRVAAKSSIQRLRIRKSRPCRTRETIT